MTIISEAEFRGDLIITDPLYIMADNTGKQDYPQLDDYIPVIVSNSMLDTNKEVRALYNRSLNEYNKAVEEWKLSHEEDWDVCEFGDRMDKLGFTNFLVEPTEYGPWMCETRLQKSDNVLGKFSSDSGLVGVFLLSEIQRYNIKYRGHYRDKWAATVVPGFEGRVSIVNSTGKSGVDARVSVIGVGNINFYTQQIRY